MRIRTMIKLNNLKVDSKKCEACGTCIEYCSKSAIKIVGIWFHKHAKILNDKCLNCGTCAKICPQNAIISTNNSFKIQDGISGKKLKYAD